MNESKCPDFDEAVRQLGNFLDRLDLSRDVGWFFCDDIIYSGGTPVVRVLDSPSDADARTYYEQGRQAGLDIRLTAHCLVNERPWCFITADNAGETGMPDGLSVSCDVDIRKAEVITSRLHFWFKGLCVSPSRRKAMQSGYPQRPARE